MRSRLLNFILASLILTTFVPVQKAWAAPSCHALVDSAQAFTLTSNALAEYKGSEGRKQLRLDSSRINNERESFRFGTSEIKAGALLGLGGDNNLNMAVMSGHREVFIYDYDPRVIAFHRVIKLGFGLSDGPSSFVEFIERWQNNKLTAFEDKSILSDLGDPALYAKLSELISNSKLSEHFKMVQAAKDANGNSYTYLATQKNFDIIRRMYSQNRIHTYLGSHFDPNLLRDIGHDVAASGQKLTALYFSNSLETRWTMDHESPEAGMLMMMLGMASMDRGSIAEKFKQIDEMFSQLEKNPHLSDDKKNKLMSGYEGVFTTLPIKAQMLALSTENWNKLAVGLRNLPIDAAAQILLTQIDPLETVDLTARDYRILGEENTQLNTASYVQWTYAIAPATKFLANMMDATKRKADEIYARLPLYAQKLNHLMGAGAEQ